MMCFLMAQYSLSNIMEYVIGDQWKHTFVVPELLAVMIQLILLAQMNSIMNEPNYQGSNAEGMGKSDSAYLLLWISLISRHLT